MVQLFAVPVFFVCFRECLEATVIIAILLSFLRQTLDPQADAALYKRLVREVWLGVGLAFLICVIIGAGMIGAFYGLGKNLFEKTEALWGGIFSLIATVLITMMGIALLRISRLKEKWKVKIEQVLEKRHNRSERFGSRFKAWAEKYAMFILPFITVLREGVEAVVFLGGVGVSLPPSSFPIAGLTGIVLGCLVGYLVYRGGVGTSLQIFMIVSTCFLYLFAAGMFAAAVLEFQELSWERSVQGEVPGSGPGSFDVRNTVWHVECCTSENLGWGLFHSLLGWQTTATYGSIIGYNVYWIAVSVFFLVMRFKEVRGHWPWAKPKHLDNWQNSDETFDGIVDDKNLQVKEVDLSKNGEVAKTEVIEFEELGNNTKDTDARRSPQLI